MILKAEEIAALTAKYSYRDESGKITGNEINYDLLANDIIAADNKRETNFEYAFIWFFGGVGCLGYALLGVVGLIAALDQFVEGCMSQRKLNELCEYEDIMISRYPKHSRKPTNYGKVRLETVDGKIHEYYTYLLTDTGSNTYCGNHKCNHPICALHAAIEYDFSKEGILLFAIATLFLPCAIMAIIEGGGPAFVAFSIEFALYSIATMLWTARKNKSEIREYIANGTIGGKTVVNKGYKYDREILKKELLAYDKAKGIETKNKGIQTPPVGTISKPTEIKSRNTSKTPGGAIGREIKDMIDFFIRMFGPEK